MAEHFYYSIASGSSGNCGLYVSDGTAVLIDVGVSLRKLTAALALQQTKNALRGREGCTVCVAPRDCMESPVVFGEEGAACLVSG